MRGSGQRLEPARDEGDPHVGTDQPSGGQDYSGRRIKASIRGVGQGTKGVWLVENQLEGVAQKLRRFLGKRPER